MIKIYGYSDDLVEIEGSNYKTNEIECYNKDVRINFVDGTQILIGYSKPHCAVWWIQIETLGTEWHNLTECEDENAEIYSDIFEIESEIKSHSVIKKRH